MIPIDEELLEEILKTIGGLLFIYPIKEVLDLYLETLKNKTKTDKLLEYHFPKTCEYIRRLRNREKKE